MNKLKKLIPVSLATIMSISMVSPTLADTINTNTSNTDLSVVDSISAEYSYIYKGVEITGNIPLNDVEISNIYNSALNKNTSGGPVIYGPIEGGSWVYEVPPTYRSYSNAWVGEAANLIVAYILKGVPKKVTDNVFANWVFTKMLGWAKASPSYVGSWVTSSWSNYDNRRNYHATLVHYSDSSYSQPLSIQYFECNYWFD
ncbi:MULTISPECIES: hypothetical protein [Heyndrickxia]|uniref:hypothetical protein n=1 Tax=Heyndrickxia TaxID=2837504 RepID=UPI001B085090|nr:hypothetical protein [Heyndrickxia oleronia]GIN40096.1 hypothetical protein J19TS1_30450 [Heyndrickxia oleronia]